MPATTTLTIRNVPVGTQRKLKKIALENKRSMNAQVLSLLEEALDVMADPAARQRQILGRAHEIRMRTAGNAGQHQGVVGMLRDLRENN